MISAVAASLSNGNPFSAVVAAAQTVTPQISVYVFDPVNIVVTGGTGSYTITWHYTVTMAGGSWVVYGGGGTTSSYIQMAVGHVDHGDQTKADVYAVVTDNISGKTATSNTVTLDFTNTTP